MAQVIHLTLVACLFFQEGSIFYLFCLKRKPENFCTSLRIFLITKYASINLNVLQVYTFTNRQTDRQAGRQTERFCSLSSQLSVVQIITSYIFCVLSDLGQNFTCCSESRGATASRYYVLLNLSQCM